MDRVATALVETSRRHGLRVCFKASFDKANRARLEGARGPGLDAGLRALARIRSAYGIPVLTDIHEASQAAAVAEAVDVLQIPAFLSRQTDLLVAAGRTGRPVNVKKGQWMHPDAMRGAVEKIRAGGTTAVAVTERGTFFGYGDLVVDFRSLRRLGTATGASVIFDATHSVQQPGQGAGGISGGRRDCVPDLLAAAAVSGADGFFLETHPDPEHALSDAATQWPLDRLDWLVGRTLDLWHRARETAHV
ncbi:MAG: 2-dehydro-3-deoxyphosphooctonate aldolase [Gemmatimonadetes bacterium]|nr:2-dehydro-3-deoxyphosphooctonate aldolase [Gemmatimonadota bacterium]